MHRILVIAFLTIWLAQKEPTITWNPEERIDWSHFKAQPESRSDVIAVTASGLSFQYSTKRYHTGEIDYIFEVEAQFYPEKSWYVKELVTDITLAHERLHFDITELHARKMRQMVKNTVFTSNIDDEMDVIHRTINAQLRQMQQQYDKETDHSRTIEKQMVWQKYVEKKLAEMEGYAQ